MIIANKLKNMRTKTTILLFLGVFLVALVVLGSLGNYFIRKGVRDSEDEYANYFLSVYYIGEIKSNLWLAHSLTLQVALDRDPEHARAMSWRVLDLRRINDELINGYEEKKYDGTYIPEAREDALFQAFLTSLQAYRVANQGALTLALKGTEESVAELVRLNRETLLPAYDDCSRTLQALSEYTQELTERKNLAHAIEAKNAMRLMWSIVSVLTFVLLGFGLFLSRDITGALETVIGFAKRISEKDLSGKLPADLRDRQDEFGDVGRALDRMQTNLIEIITKLDDTAADLEISIDHAERASMAKSNFLSRMSHEIRTPLNAIIGMTHIARKAKDTETVSAALDKIASSSIHLLSIVNDVLDMSKIEADKFDLVEEPFSLEQVLIDICNVIGVRADEKSQNVIVDIDPAIPTHYEGDPLRLSQVITNLMSNAVKFTPPYGTITLRVVCESRSDDRATLRCSVSDTGIGMTDEQMARIFTPFEQADGGTHRKFGGTGLGLAICRRIVGLMGGEIEVESAYGQGSKFSFSVRLRMSGDSDRPLLCDAARAEDLRVLVVDDSRELLAFFENLFAALGIPLSAASGGDEAIAMIREAVRQNRPYGILFIDWHMPDIDGISLATKIKEEFGEQTIVILISTSRYSEIEEHATRAGIKRFLPKPIFPMTVVETINEVLGNAAASPAGAEETSFDFEGKRILLAEDVEINREIVAAYLADTGVVIETAENGAEAVRMFEAASGAYDLILMDIHMPVMDGYTAAGRIRKTGGERGRTVPIVAMTANAFREDIDRCIAAGMNDHIPKPIDFELTMEKLAYYLFPVWQGHYVDTSSALPRFLGNRAAYAGALRTFRENRYLDDLREAVKQAEPARAAEAAHALKGVAAILALPELYSLAEAAEKDSRAGLEVDLEALEICMENTLRELDEVLVGLGA